MNNGLQGGIQVPVTEQVDVLVIGAGSAAVTAALEAKARGAKVFVVSDRSYFGEESAGTYELWQQQGPVADPLYGSLFPQAGEPSRSGFIKRGLEQPLLDAGIPFWFLTRPIALLQDSEGVAGAVLAFRTSLYAVRCRSIVDATRHGLVLRLAGQSFPARRPAARQTSLVAMVHELPKAWFDRAELLAPAVKTGDNKGKPMDIRSYRLQLEAPDTGDGSVRAWAGIEHKLRTQLVDPRFQATADLVALPPRDVLGGEQTWQDDPQAALARSEVIAGGIVPCNGLLPLTEKGIAQLETTVGQLSAGRLAGEKAAAWALARREARGKGLEVSTGTKERGVALAGQEKATFAPAFLREGADEILNLSLNDFPDLGACDVAVAGGGTGGASAGISAARQGSRTIVLEMQHGLGGVGTLGEIASYYFGNRVGFTAEITRALQEMDPRPKEREHQWNPELKMNWYHRELLNAGGEAWLRSFAFGVVQEGSRVTGLLVSTPYGSGLLRTGAVVDATGNSDIAAAAGAPCRVIDGTHVGVQGTGLSPRRPGVHEINSDHTFVDDCDVAGVTHAFVNARAKFTLDFDVAPLVDSRERRQIIGEIELSPLDFLAGRTFPDTITTASSNFDTHGFTVHPVFMVTPPDKKNIYAHVPFRCLLPQGVEGVLVTGLGISAHRDAIPVVRMQADVQNQGYAAGLAASTAVKEKCSLRSLDLRRLQRQLVEKEILAPEVPTQEDSFPLPEETLRRAVEAGVDRVLHTAVLFAHAAAARPLLLQSLENESDPKRRTDAALVLGLLGEPKAAPWLEQAVRESTWDAGWNFRGMGQFGKSMSRLDALIIALARTGSAQAAPLVLEKIRTLTADAEFSHCRAVAVAAGLIGGKEMARALADVLALPGMQGHAQLATAKVVREANDDHIETDARTLSLRELHLARGLYLCGDVDGLGRSILETYAKDLRGAYARHARALLQTTDLRALAQQAI